jgi:hypothetical protein
MSVPVSKLEPPVLLFSNVTSILPLTIKSSELHNGVTK